MSLNDKYHIELKLVDFSSDDWNSNSLIETKPDYIIKYGKVGIPDDISQAITNNTPLLTEISNIITDYSCKPYYKVFFWNLEEFNHYDCYFISMNQNPNLNEIVNDLAIFGKNFFNILDQFQLMNRIRFCVISLDKFNKKFENYNDRRYFRTIRRDFFRPRYTIKHNQQVIDIKKHSYHIHTRITWMEIIGNILAPFRRTYRRIGRAINIWHLRLH